MTLSVLQNGITIWRVARPSVIIRGEIAKLTFPRVLRNMNNITTFQRTEYDASVYQFNCDHIIVQYQVLN